MTQDVVLYEAKEGIATITLNRPERLNAWTGEMGTQYFDALDRAAEDSEVRVIVVTGAGRGFCAGADMDMLQEIQAGTGGGSQDARPNTYALRIPKPVIAAVNGSVAGLGLVHALMCDVRFAAAGAKFTTAFVRRGLIAEHGSSWVLPRLVGPAASLDILFSGRVFLAEEALEMGLVNKVFPADELIPATAAYARDLAVNCSPASMAVMKEQIYRAYEQPLDAALGDANRLMVESFARPDFQEGVASFLQKRPPQFDGVSEKVRS